MLSGGTRNLHNRHNENILRSTQYCCILSKNGLQISTGCTQSYISCNHAPDFSFTAQNAKKRYNPQKMTKNKHDKKNQLQGDLVRLHRACWISPGWVKSIVFTFIV
jgi:hypothetical protein